MNSPDAIPSCAICGGLLDDGDCPFCEQYDAIMGPDDPAVEASG